MYPVVLPVLAGFGRGRGCIDHIFTLRNIIEQSTEWQRTLCELCRFYQDLRQHTPAPPLEDITSVWNPLPTYWDHQKLLWQLYVLCWWRWHLIWSPHWCQGCVMSTLLFNLVVDWIMRRTTENQIRGIRWTPFSYLEDLDYADDLALLSHTHTHIQEKTQRLKGTQSALGPHSPGH